MRTIINSVHYRAGKKKPERSLRASHSQMRIVINSVPYRRARNMTIEIRKVISGLALWDVIANGVMVGRFDTKWEASERARVYATLAN